MADRKWDRIGSKSRGDWVLRAAYRHPAVSVRVEYAGKGGRSNRRRYSVRIIGPIKAVMLAHKTTGIGRWTVGTAKRKAQGVANDVTWLIEAGVIPNLKAWTRRNR